MQVLKCAGVLNLLLTSSRALCSVSCCPLRLILKLASTFGHAFSPSSRCRSLFRRNFHRASRRGRVLALGAMRLRAQSPKWLLNPTNREPQGKRLNRQRPAGRYLLPTYRAAHSLTYSYSQHAARPHSFSAAGPCSYHQRDCSVFTTPSPSARCKLRVNIVPDTTNRYHSIPLPKFHNS